MYTAVLEMIYIGHETIDYGLITWGALGIAFCVDGKILSFHFSIVNSLHF